MSILWIIVLWYVAGYIASYYFWKFITVVVDKEEWNWDHVKDCSQYSFLSWITFLLLVAYLLCKHVFAKIKADIKFILPEKPPFWL